MYDSLTLVTSAPLLLNRLPFRFNSRFKVKLESLLTGNCPKYFEYIGLYNNWLKTFTVTGYIISNYFERIICWGRYDLYANRWFVSKRMICQRTDDLSANGWFVSKLLICKSPTNHPSSTHIIVCYSVDCYKSSHFCLFVSKLLICQQTAYLSANR